MNAVTTVQLFVPGMQCSHCVRAISASVADLAYVQSVHVDLAARTVDVTGAAAKSAVRAAIVAAGYEVA